MRARQLPPEQGTPLTRTRTHPRRWAILGLLIAFVTGLLIGVGAGGPASEDTGAKARHLEGSLASARSDLADAREHERELERRLRRATAKGEVPDLVGGSVADAKGAIEAAGVPWRTRVVRRGSSRPRGEVIAQRPRAGTVLRAGEVVTLTAAKPFPPGWKRIFSASGSGSRKTEPFKIPAGVPVRIRYSFSGGTNAILLLRKPGDGSQDELLLNEIGNYDATTRVYDREGEHYLEVEGGYWTATVEAYR